MSAERPEPNRQDDYSKGLSPRTRRLIAIGATAAAGLPDRLEVHLSEAVQADPESLQEIRETLYQLVPFCGWAAALNAVTVLRRVLETHGLRMPPAAAPLENLDRASLRELGGDTAVAVTPFFERVAEGLEDFDPDLLAHLKETAYGYIYNRPGLDLLTRELLAVALLNVSRQERQLRYHVSGALNVGASRDAVRSAIAESERAITY
jgi:4-carboxymuconolactone decarboxylase